MDGHEHISGNSIASIVLLAIGMLIRGVEYSIEEISAIADLVLTFVTIVSFSLVILINIPKAIKRIREWGK